MVTSIVCLTPRRCIAMVKSIHLVRWNCTSKYGIFLAYACHVGPLIAKLPHNVANQGLRGRVGFIDQPAIWRGHLVGYFWHMHGRWWDVGGILTMRMWLEWAKKYAIEALVIFNGVIFLHGMGIGYTHNIIGASILHNGNVRNIMLNTRFV